MSVFVVFDQFDGEVVGVWCKRPTCSAIREAAGLHECELLDDQWATTPCDVRTHDDRYADRHANTVYVVMVANILIGWVLLCVADYEPDTEDLICEHIGGRYGALAADELRAVRRNYMRPWITRVVVV